MKFRVSQKFLCLGDDFAIRDERGDEVYYVDGKALTLRKKLAFLDQNKREIVFIAQRLFSKGFVIKRNGQVIATFRRKLFCVRPQFVLRVQKHVDYHIVGDFVGHEYTVKRRSETVARISKQFFAMSDSYGVEISGGDPIFVLAAVVIIDLVLHNEPGKPK